MFVGCAANSGPTTEFYIFDDFINLRGDYGKMRTFSNWLPAFKRLLHMICCVGIHFVFAFANFRPEVLGQEDLSHEPFWYRALWAWMSQKPKEYILLLAFTAMECNSIASGFGYRAKTDREPEDYNTIRTVRLIDFMTATSPAKIIASWNMTTQNWLKYYILLRLIDRKKPRG